MVLSELYSSSSHSAVSGMGLSNLLGNGAGIRARFSNTVKIRICLLLGVA